MMTRKKKTEGEEADTNEEEAEGDEKAEHEQGSSNGGTWKAAPPSVLSQRKIVRGRRKKTAYTVDNTTTTPPPTSTTTSSTTTTTSTSHTSGEGETKNEDKQTQATAVDQPKTNLSSIFAFGGQGFTSFSSTFSTFSSLASSSSSTAATSSLSSPTWSFTFGTPTYVPLKSEQKESTKTDKEEEATTSISSTSSTSLTTKWSFGGPTSETQSSFSNLFPTFGTSSSSPSFSLTSISSSSSSWPSFTSSWTASSFSYNTDPTKFKLESTLGTLSGVGSDADKTRELTTSTAPEFGKNISPPKEPVVASGASASLESPSKVVLNKVENHTTGEEGEEVLCVVRGKLFEFSKEDDKPTWKERGIGLLRVNSNKEKHIYRLVMRTESSLRVIINAVIYSDLSVEKIGDKQVRFNCINTAMNATNTTSAVYLLKVGNSTDAANLVESINRCKIQATTATTTEKTETIQESEKEKEKEKEKEQEQEQEKGKTENKE